MKTMLFVLVIAALFAAPAAAFAQDQQPATITAQITCEQQFWQVNGQVQDNDAYLVVMYNLDVRIIHLYPVRQNVWMGDLLIQGFSGPIDVLYGYFGGTYWPAQTINICTPAGTNNVYLPVITQN